MLLGEVGSIEEVEQMEMRGERWEEVCLGSFYIKPNYPGRSSHICNGGFLVTEAARNRGVGRLMGEGYLEWAPKLVWVSSSRLMFLACVHCLVWFQNVECWVLFHLSFIEKTWLSLEFYCLFSLIWFRI